MRMTADQASRSDAAVPGRAEGEHRPAGSGPVDGPRTRAPAGSAGRAVLFVLPLVWVAVLLGWELLHPVNMHFAALLAATPALACAGTGLRSGVWLGGGCALLALHPLGSVPGYEEFGSRAGIGAAVLCVAMASCYTVRRRARLTDELARTREVATAAQQALIRPLPPRIGRFTVAARYLSAARGAAVGGDLYEAVPTVHGLRVVIGDVRGHGLQAVGTVAALLGSFREAAHDETELKRVPHRLERALERHLAARRYAGYAGAASAVRPGGARGAAGAAAESPEASLQVPPGDAESAGERPEGRSAEGRFADGQPEEPGRHAEPEDGRFEDFEDEEFVTVLVLEAHADGTVTAVNCGHPWPYRLAPAACGERPSEPVSTAEPLPPLGMVPLPPEGPQPRRLRLRPGEGLFLFTDGAEDARDGTGRFFPLREVLSAAQAEATAQAEAAVEAEATARAGERTRDGGTLAPAAPAALVEHVRGALLRHANGRLPDDVALLALRNDGCRLHGPSRDERPRRAGAEAQLACSCP